MNQPDPLILDMVAELTRPHTHIEPYAGPVGPTICGRRHRTRVPALLHQLQHAQPSSTSSRASGYESRVLWAEAQETWARIDVEAARWVRELGENDSGSMIACVRLLGGLLASAERCKRKACSAS